MTTEQIIEAIKTLTDVVKANKGMLGSEKTADAANEKIRELIRILPITRID